MANGGEASSVHTAPLNCKPLPPCRKMTKESLAQTASDITENLMSISRMMAQQVQQSEETVTSLGRCCALARK